MQALDTVNVGPLRMRLLEKASPLEPVFFAASYYLDVVHEEAPAVSAILYLGHDRAHAERKFVRRVNNEHAKLAARDGDAA